MERQLRRYKDKPYPKAPKTESEIKEAFTDTTVMKEYGLNLNNTTPIYIDTVNNGDNCFCLFASLLSIKLIDEKMPAGRKYSMDATFSIVPHGCFSQFLIIYIEWRNEVSEYLIYYSNCSV